MQFTLAGSPFQHALSYSDNKSLLAYLYPKLMEFVGASHAHSNKPIPPSAFLLSATRQCLYLNGFSYKSPAIFKVEVESKGPDYSLVCLVCELGSVHRDYSRSLLYVELQQPSGCCRVAYETNDGSCLDANIKDDFIFVWRTQGIDDANIDRGKVVCPIVGFPIISVPFLDKPCQ